MDGKRFSSRLSTALLMTTLTAAYSGAQATAKAPDLSQGATLYVVPYAHLDTQWRWELPQSISEYLLKTMRVNFDYMDRYPHYVFNWTGANRYRLMKEYFPADYARMAKYIAAGRWFPAGSSVEEGDVNLPSAEGIFRQILYGNSYFRHEFGKASNEYMLPDCFGFPASLPTILVHSGIKGFSTQKLNAAWQPAPQIGGPGSPEHTPEGIPFNLGMWQGPDGKAVLAAVNPGSYNGNASSDLSLDSSHARPNLLTEAQVKALTPQQQRQFRELSGEPNWYERIQLDGRLTGIFADYHYVGTGDIGGAPREPSVKLLEAIVSKQDTVLPLPAFLDGKVVNPPVRVGEGPVRVIETAADQLFNDIPASATGRMPRYTGDLELINHSAGSLTSQAYHKRWVTRNEALAEAAETSSLMAAWMGGPQYPQKRLNDAWFLALGGHFHDTAAGTATPRSYEYAWNDDVLVANQFAGIFTNATQEVASALDTRGEGQAIVLFNGLNVAREEVAEVHLPGMQDEQMHAVSPTGAVVTAQVDGGVARFVAKVPATGYAVYHLVAGGAKPAENTLAVTERMLENARYKVEIDSNGDISSIFDKQLDRQLLASPLRLALSNDTPKQWPAWNMDFDQEQAAPKGFVDGPAKVRVTERGPVRVAVEVDRTREGSHYVQTISLSAGDAGNRVDIANSVDWRGKAENLKATFALSASNPEATYNEEVGVVKRPNAFDRQFEVMSHRWIDLTDRSGAFGATILTDAKNASDKPGDNTIRLTLVRSPGISKGWDEYGDQANQDWGHHDFSFAITGHAGDWRSAQTDWRGYRLSDPVRAFVTSAHPGALGKEFSFVQVSNPRIRVLALKKAEDSDEIVLRMVEMDGKPADSVQIRFPVAVKSARQITAQEQDAGAAEVKDGRLVVNFNGFEPKSFALRLAGAKAAVAAVKSSPVQLNFDFAAASNDDTKAKDGGFDGLGAAYAAEMLPQQLRLDGIDFNLAKAGTGMNNAMVANGQKIVIPGKSDRRVYILASAAGDQPAEFLVGQTHHAVTVQDWGGFIGAWDTRVWKQTDTRDWAITSNPGAWPPVDLAKREASPPSLKYPQDYMGLRAGFIKPAHVAWYASHHHNAAGLNTPYQYSYLFAYDFAVPAGVSELTLPANPAIRIFAVSVAEEAPRTDPAQPLFDVFKNTAASTQLEQPR